MLRPAQAGSGRRLQPGNLIFHGKIDEFRLYDRLLTLEEVQTLSEVAFGLEEPEIVNQLLITPNPTGGIVDCRLSMFDDRWVSLKIYDVHGREVAEVMDEKLQAGEHVVRYDASGLPAGVYFVELRANSEGIGGSKQAGGAIAGRFRLTCGERQNEPTQTPS